MSVVQNDVTVPDFCPSCMKKTGSAISLNESGQIIGTCAKCGQPKSNEALSAPMAATGALLGEAATPVLPIRKRRPSPTVLPESATGEVPENVVPIRPAPAAAPASYSLPAFSGDGGAEAIVEMARRELSKLDALIPAREADLAAMRAARKVLRKMVAVSDRAFPTKVDRVEIRVAAEDPIRVARAVQKAIADVAARDPGPPPDEPPAPPTARPKRSEKRAKRS